MGAQIDRRLFLRRRTKMLGGAALLGIVGPAFLESLRVEQQDIELRHDHGGHRRNWHFGGRRVSRISSVHGLLGSGR